MADTDQSLKTSDRILREALRQFNEQGVEPVSIRTVARGVGISPGNLTYHFKNTDAIIYELYLALVREIDAMLNDLQAQTATLTLATVREQVRATFHVMYRYRFILLDFAHISRRIDAIGRHFRELMVMRRRQFHHFFDYFIQTGILLPEPLPGQYDRLINTSILLGNAWISDAAILFPDAEPKTIFAHYTDLQMGLLVPYLTTKGLAVYRELEGR